MRELALLQQVQQVTLDFRFVDLVWRSTVELRQLGHRLQVRAAGTIGQPANDHVRFHLLAQWAHDDLLYHVGNIPGKSVTQATSTIAATTQQRARSLTTMLEQQQTTQYLRSIIRSAYIDRMENAEIS